MNKKTDLSGVKEIANTFLMLEPQKTKFSPMVIKHPFTDSGIVSISAEDRIPVNILDNANGLERWRSNVRTIINESDSVFHVYYMITKPYRLAFIKYASKYLSCEDLSRILADAWISTEYPNLDPNLSKKKLLSMFKNAEPSVLMEKSELEELKSLDDIVTVYRGVTSYNANNIKALSWTLSYDTAEWFAHRYDEDGKIYQAQIDKSHIYALFNGRNESEVIVDPQFLTDIEEAQIQVNEITLS